MTSFTPWLNGTIAGFVYLCALIFIIMSCLKRYDLGFLEELRQFAPYVAVVVLFFSYVLGYAAQVCSQHIYINWLCHHEFDYSAAKQIAEQNRTPPDLVLASKNSYDIMVLFRLLTFAFLILAIALWTWLRKRGSSPRVGWTLGVTCLLLCMVCGYVWHIQKGSLLELLDGITRTYLK